MLFFTGPAEDGKLAGHHLQNGLFSWIPADKFLSNGAGQLSTFDWKHYYEYLLVGPCSLLLGAILSA